MTLKSRIWGLWKMFMMPFWAYGLFIWGFFIPLRLTIAAESPFVRGWLIAYNFYLVVYLVFTSTTICVCRGERCEEELEEPVPTCGWTILISGVLGGLFFGTMILLNSQGYKNEWNGVVWMSIIFTFYPFCALMFSLLMVLFT